MARGPIPFNRVAAAFDSDVARVRLCESSGSEHSPENSADLSDLVNSFIERGNVRVDGGEGEVFDEMEGKELESESERNWAEMETKEMLERILCGENLEDSDEREKIRAAAEIAVARIGDSSTEDFKRKLMRSLRKRGLDAGLCKSRWEKQGRTPAGCYEYIDVNMEGNRYIVEIFLSQEFEIARPTSNYISLLDTFPAICVTKPEELKQVVRLMCTGIRESMKTMEMHVPPWRKNGYMQAKWFSSYKRTTNKIPAKKMVHSSEVLEEKRSLGFVTLPAVISYNCRVNYGSKVGLKIGNLAVALSSNNGIGSQ